MKALFNENEIKAEFMRGKKFADMKQTGGLFQ